MFPYITALKDYEWRVYSDLFQCPVSPKTQENKPENLGANLRFLALRADGKEQGCDAPRQLLVTLMELPSHHVPTAV
jgi:hypothetical protein